MPRSGSPCRDLFLFSSCHPIPSQDWLIKKLPYLPKLVTNGRGFGRADSVARMSSPPRGKSTLVLSYEVTECALPPLSIQPVGGVLR
jgi:hypothetical protein